LIHSPSHDSETATGDGRRFFFAGNHQLRRIERK